MVEDHGDLAKREPETFSFTVREGCKRRLRLVQKEVNSFPKRQILVQISISFHLIGDSYLGIAKSQTIYFEHICFNFLHEKKIANTVHS